MPTCPPDAARPPARHRRSARRLPRAAAALAAAVVVGMIGAPAAAQEPTPDPSPAGPPIGPATAGAVVCTVNTPGLDEVTGMVATADGIYAVEGGATLQPSSVEIWTVNPTTCEATSQSYGFFPIDPQDLGLGSDGALWVADTGPGTAGPRDWLTMERVDLASGANAVPYRALVPPTGQIAASAMLLDADNTPIIIANSGDSAVLYRPSGPMPADSTEGLPTLQEVGRFPLVDTDTPTPRGTFGRLVVTGGAVSPDRSKVVLRTESDAYEFAVPDGDIVRAITEGTPTITPLPEEDNGQAITYSADGSTFLTLSSATPVLRSYQPFVPQADGSAAPPASGGGGGGGGISFGDITRIALVTAFLGFVAVVVGIVGIVRFRRQYPASLAKRPRPGARGRDDDRRGRSGRERREPDRWDGDDAYGDAYGDEYGDYDDAPPPARPPRPRVGSTYGSGGAAYGRDEGGGAVYGSGGTTHGSGGTTYGSGGTTYGSGGTTHGSGGTTHGSGGTTYGSGGTTYGSGARSAGSGGRASVPGGRGSGGSGGGGGVYGRSRPDPDEDPRRAYGQDNIDL